MPATDENEKWWENVISGISIDKNKLSAWPIVHDFFDYVSDSAAFLFIGEVIGLQNLENLPDTPEQNAPGFFSADSAGFRFQGFPFCPQGIS